MNMEAVSCKYRLLPNLAPCKVCLSVVQEIRDCGGFYHYECSDTACKNMIHDFEHWQTGRKAWNEANKQSLHVLKFAVHCLTYKPTTGNLS